MSGPRDEGQRDLVEEIRRRLADGPAPDGTKYEAWGVVESTFWGSEGWVRVTRPDGDVKFHRVTVVRQ